MSLRKKMARLIAAWTYSGPPWSDRDWEIATDRADQILKAIEAESPIPEGWKLVPEEPTPVTVRALFNWLTDNDMPGVEYEDAENCYRVFVQTASDYGE